MTKSKAAFLFASQTLGKQRLYLWTFTFKELLAVSETRKRWNHLLTLLLRQWPNLQGLRVFELHQEHGLHVHLAKERPESLYRWRLWAGFGKSWEWTKVKDVVRETLFSRVYRACKEWKGWTGRRRFFERMEFARRLMMLTIEHSWPIGCGPGGMPYEECREHFAVENSAEI